MKIWTISLPIQRNVATIKCWRYYFHFYISHVIFQLYCIKFLGYYYPGPHLCKCDQFNDNVHILPFLWRTTSSSHYKYKNLLSYLEHAFMKHSLSISLLNFLTFALLLMSFFSVHKTHPFLSFLILHIDQKNFPHLNVRSRYLHMVTAAMLP